MLTWGIIAVAAAVGLLVVKKVKPAWAAEARDAYRKYRPIYDMVKLAAASGVVPRGRELAKFLDLVDERIGLIADEKDAAEEWFRRWEKAYANDALEQQLVEALAAEQRRALQREIDDTLAKISKGQAEVIAKLEQWEKIELLPPPTPIPAPPALEVGGLPEVVP